MGDAARPAIRFYRVDGDYGEFSNFSPHPIELDGLRWPTVEHYFQAQKFDDEATRKRVRDARSPADAKRLGRGLGGLRTDWEACKDDVMRRGLAAKFDQHPKLARLLVGTGNALLVEHTTGDVYWADGGDGSGRNRLGELLMELRARLLAGGG